MATETSMQSTTAFTPGILMSGNYDNGTPIYDDTYNYDETYNYDDTYNYEDYYDYEYEDFIYPGYPFERTIYVYIWGVLVIITLLANIIVSYVLLQRNMRNPTNIILVCIAIADSMTGLVTLPAYWAVYSTFEPGVLPSSDLYTNMSNVVDANNAYNSSTTVTVSTYMTSTLPPYTTYSQPQESYPLSKSLCSYFMITKYFLSKMFHSVSIWLTLFLGVQRYISVAAPFRTHAMFTTRKTVIICVCICVAAPLLHIYHLVDDKADANLGFCQWSIEHPCKGGCVYLVLAFLLRHFLPCTILVISTILFVIHLTRSTSTITKLDSSRNGNKSMIRRDRENRRVSFIVIAIIIVFLIPEVPYGCFLLYALIGQFTNDSLGLEINRMIHVMYEITLVVSFHANFYIYTFFNKRFRTALLNVIVYPILSLCRCRKMSYSSESTSSHTPNRTGGESESSSRTKNIYMTTSSSSNTECTTVNENGRSTRNDTNETTN